MNEVQVALAAVVVAGLTLIVSSIISICSVVFSQRAAKAAEAAVGAAKTGSSDFGVQLRV